MKILNGAVKKLTVNGKFFSHIYLHKKIVFDSPQKIKEMKYKQYKYNIMFKANVIVSSNALSKLLPGNF